MQITVLYEYMRREDLNSHGDRVQSHTFMYNNTNCLRGLSSDI